MPLTLAGLRIMGSGGGDSVTISVICDAQGIVRFQTPTAPSRDDPEAAGDAWTSGERLAPAVGLSLVKTYWFDHLDCDVRELQQVLRRAARGRADRIRVWMRVNEHQLIRAELSVTPLVDSAGETTQLLIRAEPTHAGPRRRDAGEPETRPVRTDVASPPADVCSLDLPAPLLRVEIENGAATVIAVNDAFATLAARSHEDCVGLPLSELISPADRRNLVEALATLAEPSADALIVDAALAVSVDSREPATVRLAFASESADSARRFLVLVNDLSLERQVAHLTEAATALADVSRASQRWADRLERWIDAAPIGLALFENAQLVRTNTAFDQRHRTGEIAPWIESLAGGVGPHQAIARAERNGHFATGFWIDTGDTDAPLVGAAVTDLPHSAVVDEHGAILRALAQSGRFAAIRIDAPDRCTPLGDACRMLQGDGQIGSFEDVFEPASIGSLTEAWTRVRDGGEMESLPAMIRPGRPANVVLTRAGNAVVALIEDDSPIEVERAAALSRLNELERTIDDLKRPAVDPAELCRLRQTARERVEQLRLLLDALGAGAFTWDIDAGRIETDETALALLSLPGNALTDGPGLTPATLLAAATTDDREKFERALFDAIAPDGKRLDLVVHVGDERRPVRIMGHALIDEREDGTSDPSRLTAIVLDRSRDRDGEAQLAELTAALAVRSAELNAIFECCPDAIRLYRDGVVRHNPSAVAVWGERVGLFDTAAARQALGGEAAGESLRIDAPDGSTRTLQSNAAPVVVDGVVVGAVAIDSDLTEVARLEALLRGHDEEIAGLFQNTGVGLLYLDPSGTILDANGQFSVLIGRGRGDLLSTTIAEFVADDDRPTVAGQIEAVLSGELTSCSAEARMVRRDGEVIWTQLTVVPRHIDGDRSVVAIVQDVNAPRRQQEEIDRLSAELIDLRGRHEQFLAGGGEGFVLLDASLGLLEANDAARRLLHLRPDADDPFAGLKIRGADGTAVSPHRLPWNRALRGKPTRAELSIAPRGDDAAARIVECDATPTPARGVMLRLRDVSDRQAVQADLHRAQARLVEAHTLLQHRTQQFEGNFVSAVQQLGAAIAAAAPTARTLTIDSQLPSELRAGVQRLADAFRVHDRLVRHYTDSTHAAVSSARTDVDAHTLAHEALRLVTARFNVTGRLTTKLNAALPTVHVDPAIVRHALWSVFAHAASQASRAPATIASSNVDWDGKTLLRLRVTWPGKSTHTAELTLARSLVEAEGGTIELSGDGAASTATIEFPTAERRPAGETPAPPTPMRVLLVEDHDSTARVLTRQLTRLRCEVTPVSTLSAARTAIADRGYDLIVCDLTMPEGSVAQFIRSASAPAIALRGYGGADDDSALLAEAGFVDHLTKPVDLNALSAAIGRIQKRE